MAWSALNIRHVNFMIARSDGNAVIPRGDQGSIDEDMTGVANVDTICIGAVLRGRYGNVADTDTVTREEVEVEVFAVDEVYIAHFRVIDEIQPK